MPRRAQAVTERLLKGNRIGENAWRTKGCRPCPWMPLESPGVVLTRISLLSSRRDPLHIQLVTAPTCPPLVGSCRMRKLPPLLRTSRVCGRWKFGLSKQSAAWRFGGEPSIEGRSKKHMEVHDRTYLNIRGRRSRKPNRRYSFGASRSRMVLFGGDRTENSSAGQAFCSACWRRRPPHGDAAPRAAPTR